MIRIRLHSTCLALLGVLVTSAMSPARTPATGNLLQNPSFESGITGWTSVAGTGSATNYGVAGAPSIAMSTAIGGGNVHLRDATGGAVVEQVLAVGPQPSGMHVKASGYFGGSSSGGSRLVLKFLNAGGGTISLSPLEGVTQENRNLETVLMYREGLFDIPTNTASIVARIEFAYFGGAALGATDALSVELVTTPLVPPPAPMDAELIVNGNFESGWANGSPLSLVGSQGWNGVVGSAAIVKPYSDTDGNVPSTAVSCLIGGGLPGGSCSPGGGGNLVSDSNGGSMLRQVLDVRGNAPSFAIPGTVALRVSAFLGGVTSDDDSARVEVQFLNGAGAVILDGSPVGPVSRAQRNSETVVVLRQREYAIPAATATIRITVVFGYFGGAAHGLADNISASLVTPASVPPIPLGVNLIRNAGFESGSLPGSPLQLSIEDGWSGLYGSATEVLSYGLPGVTPSIMFASDHGLGGLLLGDLNGGSALRQVVDLSGSQAAISSGVLRATASCWLGGVTTDPDSADLQVQFVNSAGVQVGGSLGLIQFAAVTPEQRGNATILVERNQDFLIPPGATRMIVTLAFQYYGGQANGLADGVAIVAYNTVAPTTNAFCAGDASGSTCPCGNNSAAGANEGCRNSLGFGGKLVSSGNASMSADTLTLVGTQMPNGSALYFQGTAQSQGGLGSAFGDGLRCATGTIIRLATKVNVGSSSQYPAAGDVRVSVSGAITTPGIRTYQIWYRNPAPFCTSSTFNLTNGWQVIWAY